MLYSYRFRDALRTSIGRRLAFYILMFSSVVTLASTVLELTLDYRRDVSGIAARLRQISVSYASSMSSSRWVSSDKDLKIQLDGIMRLPDMQYIEVVENDGSLAMAVGRPRTDSVISNEFALSYIHREKLVPLGRVITVANLDSAYQNLKNKILVILVAQGIKTFLVSLFILFLFDRLVGVYLRRIASHSASLVTDSRHQPLSLEGKESQGLAGDELDQVVVALNNTQARMATAIAERDQSLMALKSMNDKLEARVAERTRDLADAKAAAESANIAKSAFLANMSHELRTPLNAILGFAQIMERDKRLPEDERHNVGVINRAGGHLLSVINDVLEISRIEAGRTTAHKEVFDLTETLSAIEEMIRIRAEAKHLALHVEYLGPTPSHVQGDPHHLRQVLINLLGNGVKYTDAGEVALRIEPLGEHIRFEVADTGHGIGLADQERVFHAFYQTEAGIAKGEGTGLGLTISREFVRLMGGELTVLSEPGRGSTFGFTIPLPAAEAPATKAALGSVVGLAEGQPAPRILVVEDHPDNRDLICQLMTSIGCQINHAANGAQAVDAFGRWKPDLIWMDMRMPVMDGYAATRAIRQLPDGASVKIAALTASAFREDKAAILAAGCDDMVFKPIDANKLFEAMQNLLGLRYRYASPPSAAGETATATASDGDLSDLPEPILAAIRNAAEILDESALRDIVERITPDYPRQAQLIAKIVYEYRFDELTKYCVSKDASK